LASSNGVNVITTPRGEVALPDWAKGGDAKAAPVDRNRVG
jgi:hypothetical protein